MCTISGIMCILAAVSLVCGSALGAESQLGSSAAVELLAELEAAYCADKADYTPCNEAMGRMCIGRQCASVCAVKRLTACTCVQAERRCSVCCSDDSGQCKPADQWAIERMDGTTWTHSNSATACLPVANVCMDTAQSAGRVCDLTYRPGSYIGQPWTCRSGFCVRLQCAVHERRLAACTCPRLHEAHPYCCQTGADAASCEPYERWMRASPANYLQAIGSATVSRANPVSGSLWNPCLGASTQGSRCGPKHVCRGYVCEHACDPLGVDECLCPPNSPTECHLCCMTAGGQCRSANEGTDAPAKDLLRPVGTPCNFTFGLCQPDGSCLSVGRYHPASSAGSHCGLRPETECVCAPSSGHECSPCCLTDGGECTPVVASQRPQLRPAGTPCNYSFGVCDSDGGCKPLGLAHPSHSPCGTVRRQCVCAAGGDDECRTCCLDAEGACGRLRPPPDEIYVHRPAGTPCNFSYGVCSQGSCLPLGDGHPAASVCGDSQLECVCDPSTGAECTVCCGTAAGGCEPPDEAAGGTVLLRPAGMPCNYSFGVCDDGGRCRAIGQKHPSHNACGSESRQCVCAVRGVDECKLCCVDSADSLCKPLEQMTKVDVRAVGTPCNYSYGVCAADGHCEDLAELHPEHSACGRADLECVCAQGSGDECRLCCLAEGECRPLPSGPLLPAGTPCNYTFGVCTERAECRPVGRLHPAYALCKDTANAGRKCARAHRCTQKAQCEHVCGDESLQCVCTANNSPLGVKSECHQCCMRNGICTDVYDWRSDDLLREIGTACNFTFGSCDAFGTCAPVAIHPQKALCDFRENEGNKCGPTHRCLSGQCVHVCGSATLECRCAPGSPSECHVCCLAGGQCASVYDGRSEFARRPTGAQCNRTAGTCNADGECEPMGDFCARAENGGKQCGDKHKCVDGSCEHACGSSGDECLCATGGPHECHICCRNGPPVFKIGGNITRACQSMYNWENGTYLVRPFGTYCNNTRGICIDGGRCDDIEKHPLYNNAHSNCWLNFDCFALVLLAAFYWRD